MSLETARKLIALAADKRGNLNERQNAAVKACEMIKSEGLVVHDDSSGPSRNGHDDHPDASWAWWDDELTRAARASDDAIDWGKR
jgi:hypothetical protein